jgi:hypothetical protein
MAQNLNRLLSLRLDITPPGLINPSDIRAVTTGDIRILYVIIVALEQQPSTRQLAARRRRDQQHRFPSAPPPPQHSATFSFLLSPPSRS